jgi:Na+/melibiose symporter-like transporter
MGANALLCKPMESVLPIVAAYFLGNTDFSTNEQSETAKTVLFYLLVVPPLVFSCLQLMSWRKYNLHTQRMDSMREELEELTAMDSREAADLVA